ncbi:hypothetical protein CCR75_006258 [Bremia lactucae]|uniref:Uncharacterized protein n=1 Tax=Bremia lactucae TaxID=4779 RepID=A0A976FP03_BRELC|nr:hypothetical protein CCR75_006258 [Bremia lactucae]
MSRRFTRKGTNSQAAKRWIADELEIMKAFPTAGGISPIDTMTNKHKMRVLGEIFPSVVTDVRQDVLVAANYREELAAVILGDIMREMPTASLHKNMEILYEGLDAEDDGALELVDEEDWSDIPAFSKGTDTWVYIRDDRKIVNEVGDKVRTFAEVLQMIPLARKE